MMTKTRRAYTLFLGSLAFCMLPLNATEAQPSQDVELFSVDTLPRGGRTGAEIEVSGDLNTRPKIYFAKGEATAPRILGAIMAVRSIRKEALRSARTAKLRLATFPERSQFSEEALAFGDREAVTLNASTSSRTRPAVTNARAPQKLLRDGYKQP